MKKKSMKRSRLLYTYAYMFISALCLTLAHTSHAMKNSDDNGRQAHYKRYLLQTIGRHDLPNELREKARQEFATQYPYEHLQRFAHTHQTAQLPHANNTLPTHQITVQTYTYNHPTIYYQPITYQPTYQYRPTVVQLVQNQPTLCYLVYVANTQPTPQQQTHKPAQKKPKTAKSKEPTHRKK